MTEQSEGMPGVRARASRTAMGSGGASPRGWMSEEGDGYGGLPYAPSGIRSTRRHERERRRKRLQRTGFTASMLVLITAIPTLLYVGFDRVRNSTDGEHVTLPTDPSAPRYEANVTPTPVLLLLHTSAARELVGVTVLSLWNTQAGGHTLLIPAGTVTPSTAPSTLAEVFAAGGIEPTRLAISTLLNAAIDEVVEMTPERWAQMAAPFAPLTVKNLDPLVETVNGRSTTRFPAGEFSLAAEDVGAYLAARNPGESELARVVRQDRFWSFWLGAVSADVDALPGEATAGLGRFVRAMATATGVRTELTVKRDNTDDGTERLTTDPVAAAAMSAIAIPFPVAPVEGARPRTRVLDGIPSPGIAVAAAGVLVPAGAEIDVIGNADNFDYATSRIEYYEDTFLQAAQALQQALGVGEVVQVTAIRDQIDVTIVLGRDAEVVLHDA